MRKMNHKHDKTKLPTKDKDDAPPPAAPSKVNRRQHNPERAGLHKGKPLNPLLENTYFGNAGRPAVAKFKTESIVESQESEESLGEHTNHKS